MKRERLIEEVREALAKTGFYLSERHTERGLCFDVVARRDRALLLVKVLQNVDAFSKVNADELRMIARTLDGSPLVVGERSGTGPLEDGVIYSRFGVPILSRQTFLDFLEEGVPPFIFSAPGGLYVKLDTDALRRLREERQISLGTLAEIAGVSRRTIQMYLEGMSATVDIAIRLEEFLGEPIVVPVDPFSFSAHVERVLGSFARLEGLERKAAIVSNIGRVVERDAVLFVERRTIRVALQGIPVIGRDELRKAKDLDSIEELIAERKG